MRNNKIPFHPEIKFIVKKTMGIREKAPNGEIICPKFLFAELKPKGTWGGISFCKIET